VEQKGFIARTSALVGIVTFAGESMQGREGLVKRPALIFNLQ